MFRIANKFTISTISFFFWYLNTGFDNYSSKRVNLTYSSECALEMKGVISDAASNENLYGVQVVIYQDSTVYHTQTTSHCGKCDIKFPRNKQFVVMFSKPGYLTKKISIDTHLPYSVNAPQKIMFSLEMFEELKGIDMSVMKNPVAEIKFNNKKNRFEYDAEFTKAINEEIERSYRNYYLLASHKE